MLEQFSHLRFEPVSIISLKPDLIRSLQGLIGLGKLFRETPPTRRCAPIEPMLALLNPMCKKLLKSFAVGSAGVVIIAKFVSAAWAHVIGRHSPVEAIGEATPTNECVEGKPRVRRRVEPK
jgi:hypothetical protein